MKPTVLDAMPKEPVWHALPRMAYLSSLGVIRVLRIPIPLSPNLSPQSTLAHIEAAAELRSNRRKFIWRSMENTR
jgi:hypothetical protein